MVRRHQKCCLEKLLSKFYVHMHIFKLAYFHYCSGPGFPGDGIFISWLPCKLRYRIIIGYLQGFFYLFFVGVGGARYSCTYIYGLYIFNYFGQFSIFETYGKSQISSCNKNSIHLMRHLFIRKYRRTETSIVIVHINWINYITFQCGYIKYIIEICCKNILKLQ